MFIITPHLDPVQLINYSALLQACVRQRSAVSRHGSWYFCAYAFIVWLHLFISTCLLRGKCGSWIGQDWLERMRIIDSAIIIQWSEGGRFEIYFLFLCVFVYVPVTYWHIYIISSLYSRVCNWFTIVILQHEIIFETLIRSVRDFILFFFICFVPFLKPTQWCLLRHPWAIHMWINNEKAC